MLRLRLNLVVTTLCCRLGGKARWTLAHSALAAVATGAFAEAFRYVFYTASSPALFTIYLHSGRGSGPHCMFNTAFRHRRRKHQTHPPKPIMAIRAPTLNHNA